MNDKQKRLELLSALMDDELTEQEIATLLTNFNKYPELMTAWQHYHFIQATLQNEISPQKDIQKELENLHNNKVQQQLKKRQQKTVSTVAKKVSKETAN